MSRINDSGSLEAGRECPTEEEVVMSIDCHFILELAEMQEEIGGSRVVVEGGHHKFSQEMECSDFLRQW